MVRSSVNISSSVSSLIFPKKLDLNETTPFIYVACLTDNNLRRLHGVWIDATQDVKDIHEDILEMLANDPIGGVEKWNIRAFKGFKSFLISENESLEDISRKANFIVEHGELGAELACYYAGNLEDAERALKKNYRGSYTSELDYAMSVFNDIYLDIVPEPVKAYIDYELFTADLFAEDCFSLEVQGRMHVFSRC